MEVVKEVFEACSSEGDGRIRARQEWETFVKRLTSAKVVQDSDKKRLERLWGRMKPFGTREGSISFEDFNTFLVEEFAPHVESESLERVQASLENVNSQFANLKGICENWKPNGKELAQMLRLAMDLRVEFDRAKHGVNHMRDQCETAFLSQTVGSAGMVSEQNTGFWFQETRSKELERVCNATRVRGKLEKVDKKRNRRTTEFKLLDKLGHSKGETLTVSLGENVEGELVEVVNLNTETGSDEDIAFACVCHAAHRELLLSSHFPRWMGYSKHGELYYEHVPDTISVDTLIKKFGFLIEPQPLLYSIIANTVEALCDLSEQSTFDLQAPLDLSNLFLCNEGTRVILGRVPWGPKRCMDSRWMQWHKERHVLLVRSLGTVIRGLIGMNSSSFELPEQEHRAVEDEKGEKVLVFNRAECEVGIRLVSGDRFRLSLRGSNPNRMWRCVKIDDSNTIEQSFKANPVASEILRIDSSEELEFTAKAHGSCRLFLKELDWWQSYNVDEGEFHTIGDEEGSDERARYSALACRVLVLDKGSKNVLGPSSCSPSLAAVLSACSGKRSQEMVQLRDLQRKYEILQIDPELAPNVVDDFETFTR